jgi:ABC-type antimicrobial peptide transport system permease subunit
MTIIGVVADSKYQRLQETTRDIAYLPYLQSLNPANADPLFATVRVASLSEHVTSDIRDAIVNVQPGLTPRVERLNDRIRESLVTERLLAVLAIALAVCALALACAGLVGLMMHQVARRTMEIGIRMALGASARKVLREVLGHTLLLTLIGTVCGVTIASSVGQWIGGVLHGISPTDSVAFVSVAIVTSVVAFCAGLIPACRAASIDPTTALRAE